VYPERRIEATWQVGDHQRTKHPAVHSLSNDEIHRGVPWNSTGLMRVLRMRGLYYYAPRYRIIRYKFSDILDLKSPLNDLFALRPWRWDQERVYQCILAKAISKMTVAFFLPEVTFHFPKPVAYSSSRYFRSDLILGLKFREKRCIQISDLFCFLCGEATVELLNLLKQA
jgi:hypothetical protein